MANRIQTLKSHRAFTLVELLVVLAVIAVIASFILSALSRGKESAKAAMCLSNLHQAGIALQLYVADNNNRMPIMRDRASGTNQPPKSLPSPDMVLSNHLGNLKVLSCPSDNQKVFEQTGSSYSWNSLLNGQNADHFEVLGIDFDPHQIPVMFDKESFHIARGENKAVNYLYADGHIKNLLTIEGAK